MTISDVEIIIALSKEQKKYVVHDQSNNYKSKLINTHNEMINMKRFIFPTHFS